MPTQMAPPPAPTDALLPRSVDPRVWKACAGDAAGFPAVGSVVFYFPQGHAEQASSPVDVSAFTHSLFHRCLVTAVDLLSNPQSEEMFSRVHLAPVPLGADSSPRRDAAVGVSGVGDGFMSSVKVLTQSDAHNGGGFSVPKFCADSLFPPLDYQANTPAQNLSMRDVQGNVWEFRHIYRGKPPRHLLTTGWSDFVNEKSLIAGDSVIFMRSASEEELFIGVRRKFRGPINVCPIDAEKSEILGKGLWRTGIGRIPSSSVVDAMTAAKMNMPFEVLYYPGRGSPEFVVPEGLVNTAMEIHWTVGMRVQMPIVNGVTGPQGTVEAVNPSLSPWRMLQVIWDGVLKDTENVSPWQVELVSANHEQTPFPVTKRLKMQQGQCLDDKESNFFSGMSGLGTGVYDASPNYRTFPVGIQGARHDSYPVNSSLNLKPINACMMSSDDLCITETAQNDNACTVMDNGNGLQSRDSSLRSHRSIPDMNMNKEIYKPLPSHPIKEVSGRYFKLFGNFIQVKQHIDNDANGMQGSKNGQIVQVNQHVASDTNEKRGNKDGHIDHVKEPIDNSADGYGAGENDQTNQITLSGNSERVDQQS